MSDAGEVGALLSGATTPLSLRVRYRIWQDHQRAAAVRERSSEREPHVHRLPGGADETSETEIILSIWRSGPDRLRVEFAGGARDGAVEVRVGERWWSAGPGRGVLSSDQCLPGSAWLGRGADSFLDPADLVGPLRFMTRGHGVRVGRPVIIADAWPHRSAEGEVLPPVLGAHADRYRVEVDADRGLILSVHAYLGDKPFQTIDTIELELDEAISPELFELHAPEDPHRCDS